MTKIYPPMLGVTLWTVNCDLSVGCGGRDFPLFREKSCKLASEICASFLRKRLLAKSFHQGKQKTPHFIIGNGLDPNSFGSDYRVARAHNNLGVKYHFSLRQITFSRHTKNEFFVTVNISVDRRVR